MYECPKTIHTCIEYAHTVPWNIVAGKLNSWYEEGHFSKNIFVERSSTIECPHQHPPNSETNANS
jgi:hypothetical protein